jgi:molybdopterin converting factor small subunit
MTRIKVRSFFAVGSTEHLACCNGGDHDLVFNMMPGDAVEDALKKLRSLGPPQSFDDMMLHVFVNGRQRGFDHILQDGDVIDLHIPSSGG